METVNFQATFLRFVDFSQLTNWSVGHLLKSEISYNHNFQLVILNKILKRNKTTIQITDNEKYKRITIKMNNGGVFLRDEVLGKEIGTKNQFFVKEKQFVLSKIDARNGAFGIVKKDTNNAVITGNFWAYDVDYSLIEPIYLELITTTKQFIKFCQQSSVGTTNRHYLQEDLFLVEKIPLPNIDTQKALVQAYQDKIAKADELEKQANQIDSDIEQYLFEQLGIEIHQTPKAETGKLRFVNFRDLKNWTFNDDEFSFFKQISCSPYPLQKIGNVFQFITRTWRKQETEKQYIEIGSIDANLGILETKTIKSKNAPSRATQIVKTGDLILGLTRPYLKKFVIISSEFNDYVASSGFAVVENNPEKYDVNFLNEVLRSPIGIRQFKMKMTGSLYPAITQEELEDVQIPLPDLSTQIQITTHIQAKKQQQKSHLTTATALRLEALAEFEQAIFQ